MNWFTFLIGSSVGKKMLMAATGLCLIAFLSVHLIGNLIAFAGAEAFNAYAAKLHSLEPLLTIFNIGLVTLGLIHIVVGVILFFENLKARPIGYKVYRNPGGRTVGSNTMPYTGGLILAFVIFHLLKFTFVDKSVTPIFQLMSETFANPLYVILYVTAMIVVALHVSHGFWSLFQTIGLNNRLYMPLLTRLGMIVTCLFGIGFACLPIYIYLHV
jgi:succinate dehydrogenase / fumarate reductase cytochrome b subunit